MKLKSISKFIVFGILLNSINTNSLAGVLSDDARYETFMGNYITVNDILEEDKVDVKIEGNTLVNIGNKIGISYGQWGYVYIDTQLFKLNTQYTILINNVPDNFNWYLTNYTGDNYYTNKFSHIDNIKTFTYNKETPKLTIHINDGGTTNSTLQQIEAINVMIFEGDLTLNPPTKYFEGIQSSFEDNLITQELVDNGEEKAENLGKYKVEYKATGKNLFDANYILNLNKYYEGNGTFSNATYEILNSNEFIVTTNTSHWWQYHNIDIFLKPNTNYRLSYKKEVFNPFEDSGRRHRMYWMKNGASNIIKSDNNGLLTLTIGDESPNGGGVGMKTRFYDIQIEEVADLNSDSTEYEPFKESINTFYLNSPLLEGDTIEYINSQVYHVRRSGKVVLDGSDDEWWYMNAPLKTGLGYQFVSTGGRSLSSSNDIVICDKIPSYGGFDNESYPNNIWVHNNKTLVIHTPDISDTNEFNLWLQNNPITVVYELENPIYEPIKADLSVQLFEGTTQISNNSTIPANMEIIVDRTINRAVEAIELAKNNPTIENLSKARMWSNLLKESIKKDELQSEINNITDIEDLQLERKSVTANVDIYIKSDNALSMTLSTNSIIFDNYSGVSDIEKLNALEITINSSLPYDLNAYLESEIQNSDKSASMDSNLFQIKESNDLDYKTFVNTVDKIILKEDCSSGNYNRHSMDLKIEGSNAYKADVYKTVIKFEAQQK